jgi:hypothetical protein
MSSQIGCGEPLQLVRPVAERSGTGLAAPAEGDGPFVGGQGKSLPGVVSHPKLDPRRRQIHDERAIFPAPDRDAAGLVS